jgi:prepilin-type N-terminal cleavage/methylation domain-containing protein
MREGSTGAAELLRRSRGSRGFTLIELLLAMAILAMLVTALFTFVFSMGEIWGRGGEKRLFSQHVNAVTRHVESLLRRAAWPHVGASVSEPFTVREVRTSNGSTAYLFGFDLVDGDRLMRWPEEALPEVECSLGFERDHGLVLYWWSRLEKHDKTDAPRTVVISPLVTKLTYAYHDDTGDSWRKEENMHKDSTGAWVLPDRLILSFKQEQFEEQRELTLPPGGGGVAF